MFLKAVQLLLEIQAQIPPVQLCSFFMEAEAQLMVLLASRECTVPATLEFTRRARVVGTPAQRVAIVVIGMTSNVHWIQMKEISSLPLFPRFELKVPLETSTLLEIPMVPLWHIVSLRMQALLCRLKVLLLR